MPQLINSRCIGILNGPNLTSNSPSQQSLRPNGLLKDITSDVLVVNFVVKVAVSRKINRHRGEGDGSEHFVGKRKQV